MSKIIGISAGRPMGNSELLLKHALKAAEEEGHEVSLIRLHDYYIKPCTGCELCTKLGRSGEPVHCMYKWDEDDFYSLMTQINESQGLILAAPAYHLMPPGIVTVLMNRLHSFGYSGMFAQQHKDDPSWRKICATIAVGGSDWQGLQLTIMNFAATELICSQMNLVDQMSVTGVPAKSMVATRPECLERAALLGKHVAEEVDKEGPAKYRGDRPEVCPICHNELLLVRNGRVSCPVCDVHGDIELNGEGKIGAIKWDGGIEKSRFSQHGSTHHDDVMLKTVKIEAKKFYVFSDEQKETIQNMVKEWKDYLPPVKPNRNCCEK